ncbi:FAD-binding protein [Phenylobacterium sp.]|uniref:FAD-binding protein n=1 Tax=Phenylobacterium sp. TaxID=1871053 RepID=UPI0035B0B080
MSETWSPANADQALEAVRDALAAGKTLELVGRATRRALGRPVAADVVLDLSGLSGIVAYQPEELILAVRPGTGMAEIGELLAAHGQCLAFEPPDFGPLWGLPAYAGTIGGTVMTGRGGPRRLTAGAPRDHSLGIKGVNGFGEAFAAGGRVVKNVTGFDLPKLAAGSFGTLFAATELTLKVLPAPPTSQTLVIRGLSDEAAIAAMARAMGCPAQVSSAAHLPADIAHGSKVAEIAAAGASTTLLRVEGVKPSVTARTAHLAEMLADLGRQAVLDQDACRLAWAEIADARVLPGGEAQVWKLSVPPTLGAGVGRRLADELSGRCLYDWAGGGVWLELPAAPDAHAPQVRAVLAAVAGGDGHATLMRAAPEVRATIAPFQPPSAAVAALSERVRRQFDPQGIFNPGRMHA